MLLSAFLTILATATFANEALPTLSIAGLKFGTANWELSVIKRHGLDHANGFNLEIIPLASTSATKIAFQGGEADVIISDWIWIARQRQAGKDFAFIPYSKAVGGLMVNADSSIESLADIKGAKIGIAGGPLDKSWIILRAYAEQEYGLDLVAETEQVFGGAPLIFNSAKSGELDGAINFWHFMAKMEAAGMRKLIGVNEAATALGLDLDTPLLGYVVKGEMVREHPDLISGLAKASRAAKEMLATDDGEWLVLRPEMNAANDAEFEALKAGFIAGIPTSYQVDNASAAKVFALMARIGGRELVGNATSLPEGVFLNLAD